MNEGWVGCGMLPSAESNWPHFDVDTSEYLSLRSLCKEACNLHPTLFQRKGRTKTRRSSTIRQQTRNLSRKYKSGFRYSTVFRVASIYVCLTPWVLDGNPIWSEMLTSAERLHSPSLGPPRPTRKQLRHNFAPSPSPRRLFHLQFYKLLRARKTFTDFCGCGLETFLLWRGTAGYCY